MLLGMADSFLLEFVYTFSLRLMYPCEDVTCGCHDGKWSHEWSGCGNTLVINS